MRSWKSWVATAALLLGGGAIAQDQLAPALQPARTPGGATALPANPTPPANGVPALTKADLDGWLDGYFPYALRSSGIPGAVVTVVKDGKLLTARGFGYADLARKAPVDPELTLFRPGSVSKLVTWTAVMQQAEAGKIDLDADVNRYLDFKIPAYKGQPVTMRHILTHTAGFEEAVRDTVTDKAADFVPIDAYLKRWTPARIYAPGTTPAYSNWATTLAGYIVQRVSGQDFDTYVERRIFAPLGMRNSTFRQPLPAALVRQMSVGYSATGEAKTFEYVVPAPAGSLSASGTDMARFMIAHLQRGTFNGQNILRPDTADQMHNSPLSKVNPLSLMPPLNRMELGFFETNLNGREIIGHLGDTNNFHTSLHLFMRENVGLYVSFNSPGKEGAVGPLRTAVFEDFADRYFPNVAPPAGHVDAKTAAEHARMMTGEWIASRRSDSSFLNGFFWLLATETISTGPHGELVIPGVKDAAGHPRHWVEVAPFVWHDVNGHDRVAAKVINGKVVGWVMDLAAPFEVFQRVPAGRSAGWIKPALYLSLAILLLAFLYWPVAWFVRRHHRTAAPVVGRAGRVQRATRIMAGLEAALLIGWIAALTAILGGSAGPGVPQFLALCGIVIFVGTVLVSGYNLWLTWTDGRGWPRKLGSLLVFAAALLVLYVAVIFNLMTISSNY